MSKTVVVGMSGGVDSSVAAFLLREQGYRVVGLFMKNWDEKDESGECLSAREYEDVARVADRLGIPYYAVEFVEEYWKDVFEELLAGYRAGETPNPDVLCNREIKFKAFAKHARAVAGSDLIATGHYCRTEEGALLRGLDPEKDQSYFLHAVGPGALESVLFPIGGLKKSEVREIARRAGLPVHDKKDSTGLCFIGERKFRPFLQKFLEPRAGEFQNLDGTVVGSHEGAPFYTLGQRRGLGLGGEGARWFVVGKDVARNIVFVERGEDHPALYADSLIAHSASWIAGADPLAGGVLECTAKIRYRQPDQECAVARLPNGRLEVRFARPQRAITPRQSVVFYRGDVCLGGAVIERGGATYFERGLKVAPLPTSEVRRDMSASQESLSEARVPPPADAAKNPTRPGQNSALR